MSTIKSSAENLTLNADGANNDIIFQSNGSNVATLDQAGLLTATTFAGSGASLTSLPNGLQLDHSGTKKIEATATGVALPTGAEIKIGSGGSPESGNFTITNGGGVSELKVSGGSGGQNMKFNCTGNTASYLTFHSNTGEEVKIKDNHTMFGMSSKTETVSTQSAAYFAATGSDNEYASLYIVHNSAQKHGIVFRDMNNGGTQLDFRIANGTQVGSINTSSSATTYATSSDYRLKENVDYTWDATTRLKQLKPARFNFISDDTNTLVDGFIAHEVSGIVPEAITGTKDGMTTEILYTAEDEETQGDSPTKSVGDVKEASKPAHQGIDQSKLVPLLVKTIQEMEARITALEA